MSNSTKYVEPLTDMMTKKKDIKSYFLDYKETGKRILINCNLVRKKNLILPQVFRLLLKI